MNKKTRKALSLISGGLDSLLATKLIIDQEIEVHGINFFTGFTGDHDYAFRKKEDGRHGAKWVVDKLGIDLHIVDAASDFKPVLLHPKYGYGSNLNPCLDCKLFMIKQAKKWMEENGYDFLITGEVLGQRPMSQRKDTLPIATKITSDLIVRPLSAKLMEPTFPEREGWIDRDKLCDISGRGREMQLELARKFGFKEFPQPAGGCSLTDPGFCVRLQDLFDHRENQDYTQDDILLLYVGRHLRINSGYSYCDCRAKLGFARNDGSYALRGSPEASVVSNSEKKCGLKLVVGRNEIENNFIERYSGKNILLHAASHPGALILVDGLLSQDDLMLAAKIAAYFSKGRNEKEIKVLVRYPQGKEEVFTVDPFDKPDILHKWYR